MFEDLLTIPNLCWPRDPTRSEATTSPHGGAHLVGRFATAHQDGDTVVLTRDPLGLNKLYIGFHPTRGLIAASYLIDLVKAGIPFGSTYAVPAGSSTTFDLRHDTSVTSKYDTAPTINSSTRSTTNILTAIQSALKDGMQHLAAAYPTRPFVVCLSGGADSSLIAAYAARYLPRPLTAYTYYHAGRGATRSQDVNAASMVAQHIGLRSRLVGVDDDAIFKTLPHALIRGQDWRDFNVHAAIVNDQLARAIAQDHPAGPRPLVLTGDLMNEFLGDYSPVHYAGETYYQLPQLSHARLRESLTRGLQTGDREVGIFSAYGLDVVQPYGWAFRALLELPAPLAKYAIVEELAQGALPDVIVRRPKVRAQIGDPTVEHGILPTLLDAGLDYGGLEAAFCGAFQIENPTDLRRTVLAGIHRPPPRNR